MPQPIQFAVNYSPQAADLLRRGAIRIDRFKCPDWPDLIANAQEYAPVAVHFDLRAGGAQPPDVDWAAVEQMAAATDTPFINLHLGPHRDEYPHIPPTSTDPAHQAEVAAALLRDVQLVVDRFGPERVIVENVPYRGGQNQPIRPGVEPAVIRQVVAETGCGLLLDLPHGIISAHYMGLDRHAYLDALPVAALREMHVTGMTWLDEKLTDHLELLDPDWATLEWALDRIGSGAWRAPWMTAFEYGGIGPIFEWRSESRVIAAQVPRLYDLVHGIFPTPLPG